MELTRSKDFTMVTLILEQLIDLAPKSAKLRCVLAAVYWDTENLEKAVENFGMAIELSPTHELSSLGLFHCLWDQGKEDDAFKEMRRFQSIADSEDYRRIVEEIDQLE